MTFRAWLALQWLLIREYLKALYRVKRRDKRDRPASDRRRNTKTARADRKSAKDRARHAVRLPGVQAIGEARASEVIGVDLGGSDRTVLTFAVGESLELKTASETRHHSMPTPAELEAEGYVKFYRDWRYAGAWMMARKIG